MEEKEVKFLNVNKEELENKIAGLGATKEGDYFYKREVFDYPDFRLDKNGAWLRLRDEGNRITLSYKQRLGIKSEDGSISDESMKEVEIVVNDFEKTAVLLKELGFIEKHYAENKRTRWIKDGVEFDIDTWPALEPYLEIESSTWEKVDEAIAWLGLDPKDKKIFSTNQIYKMKGMDIIDYIRLTFDGLVKRK
ncbi:class IV adenylate cyclase [Patescibacteria group bacterium]|nr:class IV adenylate cyclase [Patescibacteria group bacterium]MCL5114202.1 class IV adenylate cyclase [Patescibacteria group bacterium]